MSAVVVVIVVMIVIGHGGQIINLPAEALLSSKACRTHWSSWLDGLLALAFARFALHKVLTSWAALLRGALRRTGRSTFIAARLCSKTHILSRRTPADLCVGRRSNPGPAARLAVGGSTGPEFVYTSRPVAKGT